MKKKLSFILLSFFICSCTAEQDKNIVNLPSVQPSSSVTVNKANNQFIKENLTNTTKKNNQSNPAISMNNKGEFASSWISSNQDGDKLGIIARIFDIEGKELLKEFIVNKNTIGKQTNSDISLNNNSEFMTVWEDDTQDKSSSGIFASFIDKSGNKIIEDFQVNQYTSSSQQSPVISSDGENNFIIVWESSKQDQSSYGVFARKINTKNQTQDPEFQVNTTTTSNQDNQDVSMNKNGDFIIVWQSSHESNNNIFGQRYNNKSEKIGNEFNISNSTDNNLNPSVYLKESGDFIVTWETVMNNSRNIIAKTFNSKGEKTTDQIITVDENKSNSNSDVTGLNNKYIISWERQESEFDYTINYKEIDIKENKISESKKVNSLVAANKTYPTISSNNNDLSVISWEDTDSDSKGIFAKIIP